MIVKHYKSLTFVFLFIRFFLGLSEKYLKLTQVRIKCVWPPERRRHNEENWPTGNNDWFIG